MAKYRITEDQLQKVFESLEMKKISEMDNYNYPAGSDTKNAPWNQEDPITSDRITADGSFKLIATNSGEFLILNGENNQLLYTLNDVWDDQEDRSWVDIKDRLEDFLEIPQETEFDGEDTYSVNKEDWKSDISNDEVAEALVNYLNYKANNGENLGITDTEGFSNGAGQFLLVTPENVEEIYDDNLRQKAIELLGNNS